MINNKALPVLLLLLLLFISTVFAAKDDPREPYKSVNAFCKGKNYGISRQFCTKALKSHPRSALANDTVSLLYISVDLAVGNTNKTREYMANLWKKKEEEHSKVQQPLISTLKECVSAYDLGIKELKIIPDELKDDPALASYDALMARDALESCKESLKKNKITNRSILLRHKIATSYVILCVDIARKL